MCALGRNVDPFTLHIYAALAEQERRMISPTHDRRPCRCESSRRCARQPGTGEGQCRGGCGRDTALRDTLVPMAGLPSRTIADKLNQLGMPAPRGGAW